MAAFCLLSLVLAYVGVVYTAALPPTVVDLGYAQYSGTQTRPGTVVFLGIPYAEPPVGQLRFRKPNPLDKNRVKTAAGGKAVDAASYKPFCIQGAFAPGDRGGAGSEDCLDVDVYKPTTIPPGKRLPVLVYIHGGAYVYGAPQNWPFNDWVNQQPNLIVVSVYYRLSALGFLAHPDLKGVAGSDPARLRFEMGNVARLVSNDIYSCID